MWAGAFALAAPAAAEEPTATVTAGGREASITLGGLLQVQGETGDAGDSRWGTAKDRVFLRRARMTINVEFLEDFDARIEGDYAGSLSPAAGLRAQLTDAYVNWNRHPQANVRAGQFKTPFGFEQLYADARLPLAERALASDRIALSRQLGVQVSGDFADKRYGYAVGEFNGNGTNGSANDDSRFTGVARLWARPVQASRAGRDLVWAIGAAGYRSDDQSVAIADLGFDSTPATSDRDGVFRGERRAFEVDSQLTVGPVEVWAEVFRARFEPANAVPRHDLDADGTSLVATWSVVPDRWQAVVRYETFDPDTDRAADDTDIWTLGGNWLIKGHDLKLLADLLALQAPGRGREYRVVARIQAVF
jgi:phosphate-selective porin